MGGICVSQTHLVFFYYARSMFRFVVTRTSPAIRIVTVVTFNLMRMCVLHPLFRRVHVFSLMTMLLVN